MMTIDDSKSCTFSIIEESDSHRRKNPLVHSSPCSHMAKWIVRDTRFPRRPMMLKWVGFHWILFSYIFWLCYVFFSFRAISPFFIVCFYATELLLPNNKPCAGSVLYSRVWLVENKSSIIRLQLGGVFFVLQQWKREKGIESIKIVCANIEWGLVMMTIAGQLQCGRLSLWALYTWMLID